MSEKKVRAPSKPRAKPVNKTEEKPVEVTAVVEVKPVEVVAVVESKPVEVTEVKPVESKQGEKQEVKTKGINISAARTRNHLDKLNLNTTLLEKMKPFKKHVADYNAAVDRLENKTVQTHVVKVVNGKNTTVNETRPATKEELDAAEEKKKQLESGYKEALDNVTALSAEKTRFSSEASVVMSIVCESVVSQLATHTMDMALADKKKIIQVEHLHNGDVSSLSLYPLFKNLPVYLSSKAKYEEEARVQAQAKHDAALITTCEKEWKKKYDVKTPKKKKADVAEPVDEQVPHADPVHTEEEEEENDSKTLFKFYIQRVCNNLKLSDEKYKNIRISTEIRVYLSDLVIELIHRLATLINLTSKSMKNKTINEKTIMRTIQYLLIDGHDPVEAIELKTEQVKDPVAAKDEFNRRKEAQSKGVEYKGVSANQLPTISGVVATRKITYPTSGYAEFKKSVQDRLALYRQLNESK